MLLEQPEDTFVFPLHALDGSADTSMPTEAHNYLVFPFCKGTHWYGAFIDRTPGKETVVAFLDSDGLSHVEDVPRIYRFLQEKGYLRDESFYFVEPAELPRQENSQDSGAFFLLFLGNFLQNRRLFFKQIVEKTSLGWVVPDHARSEISGALIRPLLERLAEKIFEDIWGWVSNGCQSLVGPKYAPILKEMLHSRLLPPAETNETVITSKKTCPSSPSPAGH